MKKALGKPEEEISPLLRFALSVGMTEWVAVLCSLGRDDGIGGCAALLVGMTE